MTASPTQRVPELVHHALIYDSDEAFLAATAGFCLDGLAAGDKVLAVTTAANIGLLKDGLGQISDGVQFVTAQDWYDTPGRTLAAYNRYVNAHKTHHRRVRIIGEPVWHGRSPAEEAEWTRYESVINAAFEGSPAWIVCPYDERVLPERVVSDARRTHPQLLTGDTARDSRVYTDPAAFTHASDHLPLPSRPPGPTWRARSTPTSAGRDGWCPPGRQRSAWRTGRRPAGAGRQRGRRQRRAARRRARADPVVGRSLGHPLRRHRLRATAGAVPRLPSARPRRRPRPRAVGGAPAVRPAGDPRRRARHPGPPAPEPRLTDGQGAAAGSRTDGPTQSSTASKVCAAISR
nr:hypothetical protein GCM10020093_016230 [Planobispora longispora]